MIMASTPRSPVLPFLVAFGSENFFLDRDIERARHWANRKPELHDGTTLTDYKLVSLCEERAEVPRTIIVDDAQKIKGDKSLREFFELKAKTDLSVVLVGIIRGEKLPELWSSLGPKAKVYERKKLKTWDTNNEVLKWLAEEAARVGVTFEKDMDKLFYQSVGGDLYRLASELRKLAILVDPKEKVTKKHLLLVTSPSPTTDPFQVAEASISKDPKRAMNALSVLYKNEGDDAFVPVVHALMKQVEKTLIIRRLLDKGVAEDEIASAVGMKPWPFKNFALPVARKHDSGNLVRQMERLCKLDVDVKGPARSKRTLIELAVLALAS